MSREFLSKHGRSTVSVVRLLPLLLALCVSGCIAPKAYIDRTLRDVPLEKRVVVAKPKPVQLLFEFQTKGAANSKATSILAPSANAAAAGSNAFSQVSTSPVTGGAVLSIKINNIPLTDDAAAKGFMTGMTFGLAGSAVTDGYVCTVEYLPAGNAPKITTQVKHAIHTVIGNKAPPPNSDRVSNLEQAAHMVTRELVANGINKIAADPKFK